MCGGRGSGQNRSVCSQTGTPWASLQSIEYSNGVKINCLSPIPPLFFRFRRRKHLRTDAACVLENQRRTPSLQPLKPRSGMSRRRSFAGHVLFYASRRLLFPFGENFIISLARVRHERKELVKRGQGLGEDALSPES